MSNQAHVARICFVTAEYPPHVGGVARSAQRLVRGLSNAGFEVLVITALWPGQTPSIYSEDGVLIHRVPFSLDLVLGTISCEDRQRRFDIFHGFSLVATYPCLRFPTKGNRPVIASIRGIDGVQFDDRTIEVLRCSNWVTSVSTDSLGRAIAVRDISNCSTVIPNGIDLSRFPQWRPTQANSGIVGTIATFRRKKNIPLLIRAYSQIPANVRKRLLLIGDLFQGLVPVREGRVELQTMIDELAISHEVEMTGYVENSQLPEYHRRMRVFVLSSDHEGMPNALLEAAASGMPIVATAVDGVKDVFTNGEDALLVEPRNPILLSEAITQVLANDDLARRLGNQARTTVAQLTPERELERYVELYKKLAARD